MQFLGRGRAGDHQGSQRRRQPKWFHVAGLVCAAACFAMLGTWSFAASTTPHRPPVASPGSLPNLYAAPEVDGADPPVDVGPAEAGGPDEPVEPISEEQSLQEDTLAAEEPVAAPLAGEQAAPPAPRPRRDYPLPPGRFTASGPLGVQVVRWQQVVETELATLTRVRRLDPNITPHLVLAIIAAESNGDPAAVSRANAVGLMQVLPSTFADLQGDGDPFDPSLNVRAGITYLDMALRGHQGDLEWALAGYNAGIAGSLRARAGATPLFDETIDYVTYVMYLLSRPVTIRTALPTTTAQALPLPSPTPTAVAAPSEPIPYSGDSKSDVPVRPVLVEQPPAVAPQPNPNEPGPQPRAQPARPDRTSAPSERPTPTDRNLMAAQASPPPPTQSAATVVIVSSAAPTVRISTPPGVSSAAPSVPNSISPGVSSAAPTLSTSSQHVQVTTVTPIVATVAAASDVRPATPTVPPVTPSAVSSPAPSQPPATATVPIAAASPTAPIRVATHTAADARPVPATPALGPSTSVAGGPAAGAGGGPATRP